MTDELRAWLDAFLREPDFLGSYPYYAAILAKMAPVADPSVKRMAVSLHGGRFFLHVNVESFLDEPQYLRGVLLHEVHHVALGHLAHPKFSGPTEPELMELAMEMSANEYIVEPLPDPITWRPYAAMGICAGQSTIERYDRLVLAQREGGAQRQVEGESIDDHGALRRPLKDPGAVEQTRQLLQAAALEVRSADPVGSGEGDPRCRVAGRSPGRLLEELTGALGPAESFLDWKTALRMFVASARAPVHTYTRPNRRFPDRIGQIPGRTYSPRAIVRPDLLVAIDTSMSMTAGELQEIARQLSELAEHARLTVVECDVEITRVYPFAGALEDVAGRGGTDLRPVFDDSFLRSRRPHGILYFTDGVGPTPEAPPSVPTLWILTKPLEFGCPWGERAWLERKAAAPRPPREDRARERAPARPDRR